MSTFLIADVGATHARFARVSRLDPPISQDPVVLATRDYGTAMDLLSDALDALGGPPTDAACLAIAGPVDRDRVEITNGGLVFDGPALAAELGFPLRIVNDFHAVARSLPALQSLTQLGGHAATDPDQSVRAVLGPGSGLGMSVLVPIAAGRWRVLASEGGHGDLAPGNHLEQEVLQVLQTQLGGVCWEHVVSGPGLLNLYRAVSNLWGTAPEPLAPEEISRRGVSVEDPVCHQTLELFFGFLGAAAGNLALTVCATGGVYVGGGIVPQLREFALESPLRRRFDERAGLTDLVGRIPLYLILEPYPGLIGAALCLADSE